MTDKDRFLYWVITMCCLVLAALLAQNFNLWETMNSKDATKISWLICTITAGTSLAIGWCSLQPTISQNIMNKFWFIADAMFTLGMIGSVSGFLLMTGDGLTSINTSDPSSIQKTLNLIVTGVGTTMVTTLLGLISSLLLRLQLEIIYHEE